MKIIATSCQILRLKCTKFDFGWGSAPDPAGGAYSTTDLLAGFKGAASRQGWGKEGRGVGRQGTKEGGMKEIQTLKFWLPHRACKQVKSVRFFRRADVATLDERRKGREREERGYRPTAKKLQFLAPPLPPFRLSLHRNPTVTCAADCSASSWKCLM